MTEEMWRNFGAWLKTERRKTGLTQERVAEKSEIHVVQISRIENGHSGAKRQTINDIVEAINKYSETGYKVDLNEALRRAGFASPEMFSSEDSHEIYAGVQITFTDEANLSEEQKRIIRENTATFTRGVVASEPKENVAESEKPQVKQVADETITFIRPKSNKDKKENKVA